MTALHRSGAARRIAAEAWIGAARGARHAVCLCIGDDVFAGHAARRQAVDRRARPRRRRRWLALNPVERQDYRKLGSLAAEVSATRASRAACPGASRPAIELRACSSSAGGSLEAITGQHVFEGARAGDGVAISVVRDTAKYIGMAVATLARRDRSGSRRASAAASPRPT